MCQRLSLAVTCAAVLFFGSCSRAPARAGAGLTRLTVGALPFLSFGPFFVALDEGFFAAEGLEVEFKRAGRTAEMLPALAGGQLDVLGGTISTSLFNAIGRGAEIRIVASKGYIAPTGCSANALVVRRELVDSGRLRTPQQLKGLRVAVPPGSYIQYYFAKVLENAGLQMSDIRIVSDVPDSVIAGAFAGNTLDIVGTAEPWITRLEQAGAGVVWMPAQQVVPGFEHGNIAYGPNLLRHNPDLGDRFMSAYLRGVRRFNEGKTARNVEILARHTGLEPALIRSSCWSSFRDDGVVDVDSVLGFQRWAFGAGLIDKPVEARALWEARFVEKASRELDAGRR
jgi:NitT/TauT family transport system substrate-binding protein